MGVLIFIHPWRPCHCEARKCSITYGPVAYCPSHGWRIRRRLAAVHPSFHSLESVGPAHRHGPVVQRDRSPRLSPSESLRIASLRVAPVGGLLRSFPSPFLFHWTVQPVLMPPSQS